MFKRKKTTIKKDFKREYILIFTKDDAEAEIINYELRQKYNLKKSVMMPSVSNDFMYIKILSSKYIREIRGLRIDRIIMTDDFVRDILPTLSNYEINTIIGNLVNSRYIKYEYRHYDNTILFMDELDWIYKNTEKLYNKPIAKKGLLKWIF